MSNHPNDKTKNVDPITEPATNKDLDKAEAQALAIGKASKAFNLAKAMSPCGQSFAGSGDDGKHKRQQDAMAPRSELDIIMGVLHRLPDPFNIMLLVLEVYRDRFGQYPDVLHPSTFNEKIQARKMFDRRPILQTFADKIAVRDYVASRVGPQVLTQVYHLTADPNDIPFASLPKRYVVKATHGSGWVARVKDNELRNERAIIFECKRWLNRNYYDLTLEWNYKDVPRRIMIEEFLDNGQGDSAEDFKLFTFNGRVEYIQVDVARFENHKKNFYDRDWNLVDLRQEAENFPGSIAPPANMEELIACAEALAKGMDFVRVDLYSVNNKVYFGEMTPTPGNGFFRFDPPAFDEHFGSLWRMEIDSLDTLRGRERP